MNEVEEHRYGGPEPDDQQYGQAYESGPGTYLRETREQLGLSLGEIAASLRLSESIIEQLEQDRFDVLPPAIFVRGYLKAYAGLLELDPEPVLKAFMKAAYVHEERPLSVSAPVQTAPDMSRGMKSIMSIGLVAIVVISAGIWGVEFYRGMAPSAATSVSSEPVTDPEPEQVSDGNDMNWNPEEGPGMPVADKALPDVVEPDPESRFTEELAGPAEGPVDDGRGDDSPRLQLEQDQGEIVPVTTTPAPDGMDQVPGQDVYSALVLSFSGPSWVEVHGADGERLLYGLVEETGERTLTGLAPYSVVIGDATNVSVELDGETVDLGTRRPGRVARLQVPR